MRRTRIFVTLALLLLSCGNPQQKPPEQTAKKPSKPAPAAERNVAYPFRSAAEAAGRKNALVVEVGDTTSDFRVRFNGIICIAKLDENGPVDTPRRAIVVEGDPSMPHTTLLSVNDSVDQAQLSKIIDGNPVSCDPKTHLCSVAFTGFEMQIRGDNGATVVPRPLTYDSVSSFENIVPHLKRVALGPSGKDLIKGLLDPAPVDPTSPVAGLFEIDGGGLLYACQFDDGGTYAPPLMDGSPCDSDRHCRQFARDVFWSGTATGVVVLQVRKAKSANWVTVPVGNTGLLNVEVTNLPTSGIPTPAHFGLFKKILRGSALRTVSKCGAPPECVVCPQTRGGIPGCSDTGWP